MAGLDAARLRALADQLEEEEREAQRELEDAETTKQREEAKATIDRLNERIDALEKQLAGATRSTQDEPTTDDDPGDEQPEDEVTRRRRTRPGRKRGMVYQGDDGVGYVYSGEDEPDRVELEAEDEEASA